MNTQLVKYSDAIKQELLSMIAALSDFEATLEEDRLPGSEIADKYLAELIDTIKNQNGEILILKVDADIAGFIAFYIEGEEDIISKIKENLYISDVFIKKEFRGSGLSRTLFETAKTFAKEKDLKIIKIGTLAKNTIMRNALAVAGFREYEISSIMYL